MDELETVHGKVQLARPRARTARAQLPRGAAHPYGQPSVAHGARLA